ncbi:hypothetical protein Thiosp_01962 [Thiorhodovibrio litoralis]|uniref:hypothetical protein n=1 Tax=Thiorhodovibrio winogradskyi TaxID=77007 RepID=UPI0019120843|nr:hypothetical protein [Thiorhodovibrio winogradskyi]MBK5968787.1 hypothetical protein [Thiorhodovibrio winogradskyi]WPL12202.1 hypothetical protein Thiosp_01962 [Thiorhodovibrio litoralis]
MENQLAIEYERGFLATCASRFDRTPKPVCPHQWGTLEADSWADGVTAALDALMRLDPQQEPEVI